MSGPRAGDVVLGRLADPDAVATIELPGGCRCPGAPHKVDTVTYRTQLGGGAQEAARSAGYMAGEGLFFDNSAANDVTIARAVVSWTILSGQPCQHPGKPHKAGEPVPVSRQAAANLDAVTRAAILDAITTAFEAYTSRLPNESGDPSADTPSESGSPTLKTPPTDSSTT